MALKFASDHRPSTLSQKLRAMNWLAPLLVAAIGGIGVAALYSVAGGNADPWAERHALRLCVGIGAIVGLALVPIRFWFAGSFPIYALSFAALALVPLIGTAQMGARRWLGAGAFSFQPSELMKFAIVLALARFYQSTPRAKISSPINIAIAAGLVLAPSLLILRQPDLGTAVLVACVGLGMMFLAGVKLRYFLGGMVAIVAALPIALSNLRPYQRRRIDTFLDPERDPLGAGYHILQSKIALGSGGVTGKGFLGGTQSQLNFLPEKHTDFIFPTFAEEFGFFGSIAVLMCYGALLGLLLVLAIRARSPFSRLATGGAALMLGLHAMINIAMVAGMLPIVGVPLPLISYGGSAMMTVALAVGLALGADVHRHELTASGGR